MTGKNKNFVIGKSNKVESETLAMIAIAAVISNKFLLINKCIARDDTQFCNRYYLAVYALYSELTGVVMAVKIHIIDSKSYYWLLNY